MLLWSNDKSFREDYEKKILQSLDMRQLSRDGRIRNPDEIPLLEEPTTAETHTSEKTNIKPPKEETKPKLQDIVPPQKVQKETKNNGRDLKSNLDSRDIAGTDEFEYEKPPKVSPVKEPEIDPVKLKEMKREEEFAKAKHALERKMKLAEKAAAKAATRAQKEAEKKLKDREKKAASSAPAASAPEDAVVEATEQEKVDDNVEAPDPVKEKDQKESTIRSRSRRRGPKSIPKHVIKRKRSNNY